MFERLSVRFETTDSEGHKGNEGHRHSFGEYRRWVETSTKIKSLA